MISIKHLGLHFSTNLSWKHHIDVVKSKARLVTAVLIIIGHFVVRNILEKVHDPYIFPHLLYTNSIWEWAPRSHLFTLQRLRNKALKIMHNMHYPTPSTEVYRTTSTLNLENLHIYEQFLLFFKIRINRWKLICFI